ncbi:MAG TPA: hypothetical protein VF766_04210 [Pyrinomonadaceae bacterium]
MRKARNALRRILALSIRQRERDTLSHLEAVFAMSQITNSKNLTHRATREQETARALTMIESLRSAIARAMPHLHESEVSRIVDCTLSVATQEAAHDLRLLVEQSYN